MLIDTSATGPARPAQRPSSGPLQQYIEQNQPGRARLAVDSFVSSEAGRSLGKLAAAASGLKALPPFAYPTIVNATSAEKSLLYGALDGLPLKDVAQTATVSVQDGILTTPVTHKAAGGWAVPFGASSVVVLGRGVGQGPDYMPNVLVHEVGHVSDFSTRSPLWFLGASRDTPFGQAPYATEYATSNRREDFADTYREYRLTPDHLKEVAPEKYQAMEHHQQQSFLEQLVDRREFRETGKTLGELGTNLEIRQSAQVALALSSVVQASNGLANWLAPDGLRTAERHATGILDTVSGVVAITGLAPLLGVGLQGASHALKAAMAQKTLSAEEVESTVSLPFRPLERALGMETAAVEETHRPGKVLAVGAGGAIGGLTGALAGPYLGVLAGYHLAGGVGGAVGFALGGLGGFLGGSRLGGRLAETLSDRAFG